MRLLSYASPTRNITNFGSHGVRVAPLARGENAHVAAFSIAPGGMIGQHPAVSAQLFIVIEGAGWVQSGDEPPVEISAGQAAFWRAGEVHASGSASGMRVVIVEATIVPTGA